MAEGGGKKKRPTPLEIYDSEGGTARYPEGFKIRGKDANAMLDQIRGDADPPSPEEEGEEDSKLEPPS